MKAVNNKKVGKGTLEYVFFIFQSSLENLTKKLIYAIIYQYKNKV